MHFVFDEKSVHGQHGAKERQQSKCHFPFLDALTNEIDVPDLQWQANNQSINQSINNATLSLASTARPQPIRES
jgi:hypothetical protein